MNRSLLAIVCSFAILPTAEAGFLAVRVTDHGLGQNTTVSLDGTTYNNVWAGTVTARYTATAPADTNPSLGGIQPDPNHFSQDSLSVYCVNLREQWRSNPFAYEATPYGIQAGGSVLNGNSALVAALVHTAAATVSTAAQRAGLQLALWEATYDGWTVGGTGLNAAGGKFSVATASSEAVAAAVGYLNTAQGGAAVWFKPRFSGGGEQDMVGLSASPDSLPGFGGNITPAPVPPTAGLAMLGGLTAFAGRRLRRRV